MIISEPLTVQIDNTPIVVIAGYECKTDDNTVATIVLVYLFKVRLIFVIGFKKGLLFHTSLMLSMATNSWVGHPRAKM